MHQPIKENLEEYLRGSARQVPQTFHAHLQACEDCANELRLLQTQANMLRSLRSEENIEPHPGFYARVMDRIEERGRSSVWAVFLQPRFARRLAIASAALAILMGTYLVTTEPGNDLAIAPSVASTGIVSEPAAQAPAEDSLQQQRNRDAVLVDLASYHE